MTVSGDINLPALLVWADYFQTGNPAVVDSIVMDVAIDALDSIIIDNLPISTLGYASKRIRERAQMLKAAVQDMDTRLLGRINRLTRQN